jgi:adenylylsulfate kinase-like enzyme
MRRTTDDTDEEDKLERRGDGKGIYKKARETEIP